MPKLVHHVCAAAAAAVLLATATAGSAQVQQPDLHAALHIRPDQETAFRAYQAGIAAPRPQIAQIQADYARMHMVSTPERIALAGQAQALQASLFNRYADATRQFYSVLSGPQQRIFDQITLPPSGPPSPGR